MAIKTKKYDLGIVNMAILEEKQRKTEEKKEDRKRLSKLWYLAVYEFLSLDFGLLEGAEGDVTETKLAFDNLIYILGVCPQFTLYTFLNER